MSIIRQTLRETRDGDLESPERRKDLRDVCGSRSICTPVRCATNEGAQRGKALLEREVGRAVAEDEAHELAEPGGAVEDRVDELALGTRPSFFLRVELALNDH